LRTSSDLEVRDTTSDFDHPPTLAKELPIVVDNMERSSTNDTIEQRLGCLLFIIVFVVIVVILKADP
jgi:hypothetical protein